jgi:hypothetical protein
MATVVFPSRRRCCLALTHYLSHPYYPNDYPYAATTSHDERRRPTTQKPMK